MAENSALRAGISAAGLAALTAASLSLSTVALADGPTRPSANNIESQPAWVRQMVNNREFAKEISDTNGVDWCQTERAFFRQNPNAANARACTTYGAGDTPSVRDANIPTSSTPVKTIRLYFNVFANNDGSSPAASATSIQAQVDQLNADYAASKIQFTYQYRIINSTTYRTMSDAEENPMKTAYAVSPSTQLNVFVMNIQSGYLGVGTFPWEADALTATGGLICDDNWFGAGQKTMTHEVGHCLGLWHTHHGVSEVAACSACWERADGLNGNTTGDFCSDTPPTPTNYNCTAPGGTDSCSATAWGTTQPQNYMGYAPDSCYTLFTPQQAGRMHWWTQNSLSGWLTTGGGTPTPTPTATATATATPTPTPTPAGDAYEPDGSIAAAKTITVNGATQTHDINPNTDEDFVKFTISARSRIKVETNGPAGGDTTIFIYNSAGTQVGTDDDTGTGYYSLYTNSRLAAGTYYVKVQSYNKATTITGYTIRVYTY